jgi:hypothetical protein
LFRRLGMCLRIATPSMSLVGSAVGGAHRCKLFFSKARSIVSASLPAGGSFNDPIEPSSDKHPRYLLRPQSESALSAIARQSHPLFLEAGDAESLAIFCELSCRIVFRMVLIANCTNQSCAGTKT